MSDQPFSFPPPPPPPPPKRAPEGTYQQSANPGYLNSRGSFRGSHAYRGSPRGGRGGYGDHRSGPSGRPMNYGSSHGQNYSQTPRYNGPTRRGVSNAPQKRDYNTAFSPTQQYRSRPTAPPAVPDFNASIQHLLARKPPTEQPNEQPSKQKLPEPRKQEPKKHNLLGLTPAKFEQDSDPEEDEDEEQKLAAQSASASGGHVFEYNGNPLMLRNRDEILAWIAERKRRFPTEAKRQAAQKEFEEKKRKREEEYKARLEAKREAEAKRDLDRAERQRAQEQERKAQQEKKRQESNESGDMDHATRARLKADKLRKKALKAQRQLEKAEEALRLAQAKKDADPVSEASAVEPDHSSTMKSPDALPPSAALIEDETSSSGSSTYDSDSDSSANSRNASDSDSDSAPEVTSTKRTSHSHDPYPQPPRKVHDNPPQLCSHFAKYKTCKFGSSCRYSHDLSRKGRKASTVGEQRERKEKEVATTATGNVKRKGLWQIMVEKEQEEERRRLLGAIITLGERGMLDDPAQRLDGPL